MAAIANGKASRSDPIPRDSPQVCGNGWLLTGHVVERGGSRKIGGSPFSPPRVPSKPEEHRALGVHGGGTTYKFVVGRHGLAAFVHFKVSLPPSVQFYWLLSAHTLFLFLSLSTSFLLCSLLRPWCLPPLPRVSTGHVQRAHCCDPCWKNENTSWTSPWRSSSLT